MLRLSVQQVEQSCLFNLFWGAGQQLSVQVAFPKALTGLYQEWRKAYLNFYQNQSFDAPNHELRGRPVGGGAITSTNTDWRGRLTTAEGQLILAFQDWLRSGPLYKIRAQVSQVCQAKPESEPTNLLIACGSVELARLPWEVWEIGSEFGTTGRIQIARMPASIQAEAAPVNLKRSRARILAIIGQDNNLNFQKDLETLQAKLKSLVTIEMVGWQPGQPLSVLEDEIKTAITDEKGWDILFFAGHSNETTTTGGELGIAPGQNLQIQDITEQLKLAKSRGLQFALFNSCNGLKIAETLIDLGLSQVAVMREPIHNQVAQDFLLQFLQNLAEYKNVRESLVDTCDFLRVKKSFTYPSAYLIPSLFRYPNTEWFKLKPSGWRDIVKQFCRPKWYELTALAALSALSLLPSVQYKLLEQRVKVQADYRHFTQQFPARDPSILLVYIDDESLKQDPSLAEEKLNREYFAKLVDHMVDLNPRIAGFDYLLDQEKPEEDQKLEASLSTARENSETLYIFGTSLKQGQRLWTRSEFTDQKWQGNTRLWDNGRYMTLLPVEGDPTPFPLSYLLALAHNSEQLETRNLQQMNPIDLEQQLFTDWMRPSLLTRYSYAFYQYWLHPITDFSIPPDYIYKHVSSQEFLQTNPKKLKQWYPQSVVMIIPGGYDDAGINYKGEDNLAPPSQFCDSRIGIPTKTRGFCRTFLGGEVHAYLFHHFSTQKAIIPIPDLWVLWLFAVMGKGLTIWSQYQIYHKKVLVVLLGGTLIYALVSLQFYISGFILLPILLPTLILWIYVLPNLNLGKSQ